MIQRGVKIQLVVFAILSVLVMAFTGARFAGLGKLFSKPVKVTAMFKDSGGIYSGAEVTERGVTVGKVGSLTLTDSGVAVQLLLDHGKKISTTSSAVVANLSFVGEQYVDLQPTTKAGPYFRDGDVIPQAKTSIPITDAQFLSNIDRLVKSVDQKELQTVVDGLGTALDGAGPDLQAIIDKSNSFLASAQAHLPETLDLIRQGEGVLTTAQQTGGELRDFSKSLASLSTQLKTSDPDLRRLLANGVVSAQQLDGLLKDNESTLSPLLANLVTLGEIQAARLPGLKQLLLLYPENVRNGFLNAPGDGTSHFGLVVDTGSKVCTNGYQSTTIRSGESLGQVPANTKAYCNLPADSASAVKGSRNAPRPAGDCTDPALLPGRAAASGGTCVSTPNSESSTGTTSTTTPSASSDVQLVSYDPYTQTVTLPDGKTRWLHRTNGQMDLMGSDAYQWLILGPLAAGY